MLCLITRMENTPLDQYEKLIRQAIAGGVSMIQLREKSKNLNELKEIGCALKNILAPLKIPLMINGHIELAKAINADGVHLGQSDCLSDIARKILGKNKIIGLSIETLEELLIANSLGCIDYVAASSIFESKSKADCKTIWGLSGLKKIVALSKHCVMAIGGINENNIHDVIKTGVTSVAVISAIHDANNPKNTAKNLCLKH